MIDHTGIMDVHALVTSSAVVCNYCNHIHKTTHACAYWQYNRNSWYAVAICAMHEGIIGLNLCPYLFSGKGGIFWLFQLAVWSSPSSPPLKCGLPLSDVVSLFQM